jgi:hypothetical protein
MVAAPVAGAVVSLLDSAGRATGRTIAGADGRFVLSQSPRAARLHVIRIGFRPRDIRLAPTDTLVDVALVRLPTSLTAMRITDREMCPGSEERGAAFELWDQARAGLLATVVGREAQPAMTRALRYNRGLSPTDEMVEHQASRMVAAYTSRPFVAAAAGSEFAERGYIAEDSSGRTYYAPDADVLLDDSFVKTHCFHLQDADDAHRGQIGLAFTPAEGSGRDTLVDVRGVIWIDRADPALRSLDFLYTGLEPAARKSRAGGSVEFRTLPNGASFIDRWVLRLAVLDRRRMAPNWADAPVAQQSRRDSRNDLWTVEIDETGGRVLSATWKDGTKWMSAAAGIEGSITRGKGGPPASNAVVSLLGTADTVRADLSGHFSMSPIIEGRYTVLAVDTTLEGFLTPRVTKQVVDVRRDRVSEIHLAVPPLDDRVRKLCKDEDTPRNTTTLLGRIEFPTGYRPRDPKLSVRWQADTERTQSLDDDMRFILCGVGMDRPVHLILTDSAFKADTTVYLRKPDYATVVWRPGSLP